MLRAKMKNISSLKIISFHIKHPMRKIVRVLPGIIMDDSKLSIYYEHAKTITKKY